MRQGQTEASRRVGEAAKAAAVSPRAVRLYEAKGLVRPADRLASGYRVFTDAHVEVLVFIRQARSLGLSLDAIAESLEISADGAPCERTQALLAQRLSEVDAAIAGLQQLRSTIVRAQRITGAGTRCGVIESVSADPTVHSTADASAEVN